MAGSAMLCFKQFFSSRYKRFFKRMIMIRLSTLKSSEMSLVLCQSHDSSAYCFIIVVVTSVVNVLLLSEWVCNK